MWGKGAEVLLVPGMKTEIVEVRGVEDCGVLQW